MLTLKDEIKTLNRDKNMTRNEERNSNANKALPTVLSTNNPVEL